MKTYKHMVGQENRPMSNRGIVGGDVFILFCSRNSNKTLMDYLPLFDFDDYWCYKSTNTYKQVNHEDFLEFKYSAYKFFKKNTHNKEHIDAWINFYCEYSGERGFRELMLYPMPPFNPNKIIIKRNPKKYERQNIR